MARALLKSRKASVYNKPPGRFERSITSLHCLGRGRDKVIPHPRGWIVAYWPHEGAGNPRSPYIKNPNIKNPSRRNAQVG